MTNPNNGRSRRLMSVFILALVCVSLESWGWIEPGQASSGPGATGKAIGAEPAPQNRAESAAIKDLVKMLNGTWQLVSRVKLERSPTGQITRRRPTETEAQIIFDLRARDTRAEGKCLVVESGIAHSFISPDGENQPFTMGGMFNASFDASATPGTNGENPEVRRMVRPNSVIMTETLEGDIIGSYGIFRNGVKGVSRSAFVHPREINAAAVSVDLRSDVRRLAAASTNSFVNVIPLAAPGTPADRPNGNGAQTAGENPDPTDLYRYISVTPERMEMETQDGTRDVYQKVSPSVLVLGMMELDDFWQMMRKNETFLKAPARRVARQ